MNVHQNHQSGLDTFFPAKLCFISQGADDDFLKSDMFLMSVWLVARMAAAQYTHPWVLKSLSTRIKADPTRKKARG